VDNQHHHQEDEHLRQPPQRLPVRLMCAVARNGVIGKGGKLPWNVPEDWQVGGVVWHGAGC
jgi:hypothetical protein